jgi:hypothetical protein
MNFEVRNEFWGYSSPAPKVGKYIIHINTSFTVTCMCDLKIQSIITVIPNGFLPSTVITCGSYLDTDTHTYTPNLLTISILMHLNELLALPLAFFCDTSVEVY